MIWAWLTNGDVFGLPSTELSDGYDSKWTDLVDTQLAEINKKNSTDLVGGHPLNSSSGSDSDSDFKDIPFPQDDTMQQVCHFYITTVRSMLL